MFPKDLYSLKAYLANRPRNVADNILWRSLRHVDYPCTSLNYQGGETVGHHLLLFPKSKDKSSQYQ